MTDNTQQLIDQVKSAKTNNTTLKIVGGNSKAFLQACKAPDSLEMTSHAGVVNYEPTELVLTARTGTPIVEIEKLLADNGQYLSFEPPHFTENTTIGGVVASGMGGPRRPWGGAPRDVLLGCRLLTGTGDVMRFGGEVMKNVAGYDVSRLMAGAQGSLGVILEVSLKVLPAPSKTITLTQTLSESEAQQKMRELAARPMPLSGACYFNGQLYIRLSGAHASVNAWSKKIGGERLAENNTFWERLRDHKLDFFDRPSPVWRISLPPAAPAIACAESSLIDWAGGQRWIISNVASEEIKNEAQALKGHAKQFYGNASPEPWAMSSQPALAPIHKRLKETFDPKRIFNPGTHADL